MKIKLVTIVLLSITLIISPLMAQDQGFEYNESGFTHGKRRNSNPLQIQLVQTFGSATPHTSAPGGGLHLGYQISDHFYIGLTSSAFANNTNVWDDRWKYR